MKPKRLRPGDTIGIVSPSWGGAGRFPHRTERGIRQIEALGYKAKLGAHSLNMNGYVSDTAKNRVQDIHDLFCDPEVQAIVSTIGGNHSNQLLPLLDFDLIASHPKIFMGFSDITVLNIAIWKMTNLITFNGPALLTDFAEFPQMIDYTKRWMLKVLTEADPAGPIEEAKEWTEEFLDWSQQLDSTRARNFQPSPGWTWLKDGTSEGILIGGCIESMEHLRGTHYWPDWNRAIFFMETSEEKPTPSTIDAMLMDYDNMGVLSQIRGLLIGRPMKYTDEEKQQLREVVLERTQKYHFPIVMDMDFGHIDPMFTLPIGIGARIDTSQKTVSLIEAAVED